MTDSGPAMQRHQVPGNRWDLLRPPPGTSWTPRRRVSVCIPARTSAATLGRTLAALSVQTYPAALTEVVVADDSSSPALHVSGLDMPFPVRVIRQEAEGFAAGRARSLAAANASGEVLVFLDADVVPSRRVIESYLRWFDRCNLVVPFGFLDFVDLDQLSNEEIRSAVRDHDVAAFDRLHQVDNQHWRERTFSSTDDLQLESPDMFRTLVGASLAVSAEQYATVGGFADLGVRGIEDIELGYRLQNDGAILIPDRSARHWHSGGRTMSGERIAQIRRDRAPFADALLPVGGFRGSKPAVRSPVQVVPRLLVHIDPSITGADQLARRIRSADGADVEVHVGHFDDRFVAAFAQMLLTAPIEWPRGATRRITQQLVERGLGTMFVIGLSGTPMLKVIRTRAVRSARTGDGSPQIPLRLFPIGVAAASKVGLVPETTRMARFVGQTRRRAVSIASVRSRLQGFARRRTRTHKSEEEPEPDRSASTGTLVISAATPLNVDRTPDLVAVRAATRDIAVRLRRSVLEPTRERSFGLARVRRGIVVRTRRVTQSYLPRPGHNRGAWRGFELVPLRRRRFGLIRRQETPLPKWPSATSLDVLVLTDLRFPGGTSTSLEEEIVAATNAGYTVGILHIENSRLGTLAVEHRGLRRLLDAGTARLILPGERVRAPLTVVKHPMIFAKPLGELLPVDTDTVIVTVGQVPADDAGTYYDPASVDQHVAEALGRRATWFPVSATVRSAMHDVVLAADDWSEVIDVDAWRTSGHGREADAAASTRSTGHAGVDRRLVIGRHSRPDRLKWSGDADELRAVYPTDGSVRVRVLGGADAVIDVLGEIPTAWEVLAFGAVHPRDFLADLDAFVYYHHRDLTEAFGRTVLEALAYGLPVVVGPHFAAVFGDACIYAEPADALDVLRSIRDDPDALNDHLSRAEHTIRTRFGHDAHRSRLERLIGPPALEG